MRSGLPVPLLLAITLGAASAEETLNFAPPPFLVGPQVSHSALGATYAYRGQAPHTAAALQVTVVEVPAELAGDGGRTPERCLTTFLDELRRGRDGLLSAPVAERLDAGGFEFAQLRWLDTKADGTTGVMGCAVDGTRYLAISYQDSLKDAVTSFPRIRAALAGLKVTR